MEEVKVGRYITKQVMEDVRIPRIFLPIIDNNEGNDEPMPQYVPPFIPEVENADIGNQDQDQEQHKHFEHHFEPPPHFEQQPQHFPQQQPQYVTYADFQQFQQNQIAIQTELGNYKQEVQGLKDKQQELYNHYNNLYNYMKEKQKFIAKELNEIKRFQVGQTIMVSSQTDPIEKQSNPNLTATYEIPELMKENAEKGRNIFYGFLKFDLEVGSSSAPAPAPGPGQAPSQNDHH
ncbi:hypothetical protein PIB30_049193 [Stylosanthes scabra]|uniref:Uncharacterized protein n=1 Tax=Stylosanthes scabra TaxID=79078 RepID=A0ABU6VFN0_9FABA|nr:hypothetical protein [Stylosanthes scabra]